MQDLAIIIVGHNSREFLPACLESTHLAIAGLQAEVWMVDNGGNDGTADFVRQDYPWCQVIAVHESRGYSYGNNLGLKAAGFPDTPGYRYAMLLNPDTTIPAESFRAMVAYMDEHPDIGVLGPKLLLANGTLDKACKRGEPTPLASLFYFSGISKLFPKSRFFSRYSASHIDIDQIAAVDSVVGACQIMRASALQKAGLMDEQFFMYGEDLDLNLRIRNAGYQVLYYPKVIVHHLKGTSTRKQPEKMIRAFYDAMTIFHRKHYASRYPALFNWLVYRAIDGYCAYKLWQNAQRPPEKRGVGSAPGQI
jgi:N-acetylglucosaminyl-diphospho-decaprenol L-rhamnosyltransferase